MDAAMNKLPKAPLPSPAARKDDTNQLVMTLAHHDAMITNLAGRMTGVENKLETLDHNMSTNFMALASKMDKFDARPTVNLHQSIQTVLSLSVLFSMVVGGIIWVTTSQFSGPAAKQDALNEHLKNITAKNAEDIKDMRDRMGWSPQRPSLQTLKGPPMPTVTSDTEICNLALSDLGHYKISSLGEATKEGQLCATFYGPARDALLRAHPWNFAIKRAELAVDSTGTPAFEYGYAFPLPSDFLRLIRTSVEANGYTDGDWRIEHGANGSVLVCNDDTISIEYVARIEDVARYDPLFVEVLAKSLAIKMCMRLTDNAALKQGLQAELNDLAPLARYADATDSTPREITGDVWVTSRL